MATDLDELQIVITSSSREASEALDKLVQGLENLNTALGNLDASKVTSFANAMGKLSNIGVATNTTSKAIKGFAKELGESFGINSKKGIEDITAALMNLYKVNKAQEQGADVGFEYDAAIKRAELAVQANYKYKEAVDSTTQSIKDYIDATNRAGTKVAMADMAREFGENFKEMSDVLGSAFKNKLESTKEGVMDLAEYLSEMNSQLGTDFNVENVDKGFSQLVETLKAAKAEALDFKKASSQGLISDDDVLYKTLDFAEKIRSFYREQSKYDATDGLNSIIGFANAISNMQFPDMSGLAQLANSINSKNISAVAKAMGEVAVNANSAVKEVSDLSTILGNGFTMRNPEPFKGVEFPPAVISQIQAVVPQIEVIPEVFTEKLLPAVINTENEFTTLYQKMANVSVVESAYDALTAKFHEFQAETSQQLALPVFEKMLPAVVDTRSATEKLFSSMDDLVKQETKLDAVTRAFLEWKIGSGEAKKEIEQMAEAIQEAKTEEFAKNLKDAGDASDEVTTLIGAVIKKIREYKEIISGMESGKMKFNEEQYKNSIIGLDIATRKLKNYKEELIGINKIPKEEPVVEPEKLDFSEVIGNVAEHFERVGEGLKGISEKFGNLANIGIKVFKGLTVPLEKASEEYVEKYQKMKGAVANFQKDFQTKMKKVSDFWKRTMRTFTFMIVRKAFTAILKEISNATQSLAMYSNAMGTAFNTDLSNMVADFQYLGRSIVSVFAPLLNAVTPIIDALVDRIATLISYIGMLFAALGGSASFTKAKKNVTNYAESLDQASKSAKSLTMGIDELNVLNDKGGGGSAKPYDGWEDAWEEVEIPDSIKRISQKMKDIFNDLFDPIKKAWNKTHKYVISRFKYMTREMSKLLSSVGEDFIEVWKSDTMEHVFENLFLIVGDIEHSVGNLAKNFRVAWDEGDKGFNILSNIAKVVDTLVQHLSNVTEYMTSWTGQLDFNPILSSFETLTSSFEDLAEFMGGVFEDVMENVILKYIKFLIEDGLPHLQHTIAEIIESFDFKSLREKLQPIESAFEKLLENLDIGKTNAFGNLGKMIGEFTSSEAFDNFLKTIEHLMNSIDAETVEKILTGIGTGILRVAEAIVKFVGSDLFNAFIDKLAEWFQNVSADDIADGLEKIAKAILIFKFAEFATSGMGNFFLFLAKIKGLKDLGTIAKKVNGLNTELEVTAGAAPKAGGALKTFGGIGMILGGSIMAIKNFFDMWQNGWSLLKEILKDVGIAIAAIGAVLLGVAAAPAAIVAAIVAALSTLVILVHDHWDQICAFFTETIPAWWEGTALPWIENIPNALSTVFATVKEALSSWIEEVKEFLADKISNLINSIAAFFDELPSKIGYALGYVIGTLEKWALNVSEWILVTVPNFIVSIAAWFSELPGKIAVWLAKTIEKFVDWGVSVISWITTNVPEFITKIVVFFQELPQKILNWLIKTIASLIEWKNQFIAAIITHVTEIVAKFMSYFEEIPKKMASLAVDIVAGLVGGLNTAWDQLKGGVVDFTVSFVDGLRNGFKCHSPSKETEDVGENVLEGLLVPFTKSSTTEIKKFTTMFIHTFETELSPRKFTTIGQQIITGIMQPIVASTDTVATATNTIFIKIANGLKNSMQTVGATISDTLKTLTQTYIVPFLSSTTWQPLLNNLLDGVFKPFISTFRTWFAKEAVEPWWNDDLIVWFSTSKWNEEIFTPLNTSLKEYWTDFTTWWNTSMSTWWETQVLKWIGVEHWEELFDEIHKVVKKVFKEIVETIEESMTTATEAVDEACEKMSKSFTNVLGELKDVMKNLKDMDLGDGNLKVNVKKPGQYATGGFPTQGTLFYAGERGAEFVSSVNGRTGVVSNGEITGIADAVYATGNNESELLAQLVSIGQAMLNKDPVVLSDKELAMAVKRGNSTMGMSIIT